MQRPMAEEKQATLDAFIKKTESSPKTQSGPIRHAAASKNVRHSPVAGAGTRKKDGGGRSPSYTTPSSASCSDTTPYATGLHFSEVKGDLFSCPESASLVHCVSEDMHMGKGVATLFKQKFGGVGELKSQGVKTGGLAVLKRQDRFVYYLVTKPRYFNKPSYETLRSSLQALHTHCISNGVRQLCMPRIGCGLDKLKWDAVSHMIQEIFADTDMAVTVYYL